MRNKLRKNHKLSFVIPTYNAADYIQSTINSIVQSKISNCEIICVDDCSVDGTSEQLEALSKKHEQLITFKLGKNQGQSFCRNFGLSKASGEYIFFFDADDTLVEAEKSLHWLLHLIDKTPCPIDLIQINNTIEEQVLLHPKSSKTIPVGQTNSALQFDNIDKFLIFRTKNKPSVFRLGVSCTDAHFSAILELNLIQICAFGRMRRLLLNASSPRLLSSAQTYKYINGALIARSRSQTNTAHITKTTLN